MLPPSTCLTKDGCSVAVFGVHTTTMRLRLLFWAKLVCQIGFFVFFLCFFGVPNIKRYQQKEVMVVSSRKHSGGILAPTISVVARNPFSGKGWRSNNITSSIQVIEDQCGKEENVQKCILERTYSLSDVIKDAHIGFERKESLMDSALWHDDFTNTFFGRLFTLNITGRRITPDYTVDELFLHLQQNFNYTIFIYYQEFFVLNTNILSFPVIIKDVSSSMGNHYWNLAVTEKFELNHPNDPCYEGPCLLSYNKELRHDIILNYDTGLFNNFEGCIRQRFSFMVS